MRATTSQKTINDLAAKWQIALEKEKNDDQWKCEVSSWWHHELCGDQPRLLLGAAPKIGNQDRMCHHTNETVVNCKIDNGKEEMTESIKTAFTVFAPSTGPEARSFVDPNWRIEKVRPRNLPQYQTAQVEMMQAHNLPLARKALYRTSHAKTTSNASESVAKTWQRANKRSGHLFLPGL